MVRNLGPSKSWSRDTHDIFGGKAVILRTGASGNVWQFRMWVSEERKYVRKTLKTRDLESAINRAETLYLQIYSDISSGKKLFGISIAELCSEYRKWRMEDVENGSITAGRLGTINSQLKHLQKCKGENTKIAELDRQSLYDYANWRRKMYVGVKDVTIRNEQATINHMMGFAYRRGYAHIDKFEFRLLRIREVSRRDTFTLKEYDELVNYLRKYASKNEAVEESFRQECLLIRDCILIGSNTMLRVGELWNLKWNDVHIRKESTDDSGKRVRLVEINVRAETSKNRKSRMVVSRGGEYFERLKTRSKFADKSDFVFCEVNTQTKFPRQKYYLHWKALMHGIGIDYKLRNLTWYSLRHFGITCRLRAGVNLADLGSVAGTSSVFIEQHYGHFDRAMLERAALKNFTVKKDGIEVRQ